jgi:hypothetical protein
MEDHQPAARAWLGGADGGEGVGGGRVESTGDGADAVVAHSAVVHIRLELGGLSLDVAQMGGGRLYFAGPVTLPEGRGALTLSIDGKARRWAVDAKGGPAASPTGNAEFGEELSEGA